MERDRAEQGREAGKLMMLRVERGGRAVCNREREREGGREGGSSKKEKDGRRGRDKEDTRSCL